MSALHWVRYVLGWDDPATQTTSLEQRALAQHAAGRKRLVEIGVHEGFTTRRLAEAMAADGVLYAIDPFFGGRLGVRWSQRIARREAHKVPSPRKIVFLQMLSWEAWPLIREDLDFLFIDGDHSLEGIRRDWADWSQRISPGGIIALHDTRVPAHDPKVADLGSCQYFESHVKQDPRFELLEQVDSLSVLRRRA